MITAVILDISTYFVTISCLSHEKNTTFRLLRDQKEQKPRIYHEFPSHEDESSSQKINVFKPGDENLIKGDPVTPGNQNKPVVDFHISRFPKCWTTSLLYAFNNHNETSISDREYCNIDSGSKSYEQVIFALQDSMKNLSISSDIKVGIKCPLSVFHIRGIKILSENSPNTKIIIGVRHPVLFFQSFFYNYRITVMYNKGLKEEVPPTETLLGDKHWKCVYKKPKR